MFVFFFFKQKTAYELRISDWSSDVCSSDLPVLGARRRKLPTGRSLRQLTEARLRLRRSQALDPLVALGKLARPHFTSMRAPKQVQGSMDGPGAGRRNGSRIALAHARLSGMTA